MIETILSSLNSSVLVTTALLVVLIALFLRSRQTKPLPPSPGLALPFVGHLYLLKKNPRLQLRQWADKYGDVFRLQMGQETTVFVNTFEAMKEAFVKKANHFSDRPNTNFIGKHHPCFYKGVVFSSGPNWKAQRTTSLSILRNFGMGKNILAEKISEEISFFTKELEAFKGQPTNIRYMTNMSVSNVICSIIFGKRFQFDDPKFINMMEMFNEAVKINSGVLILTFLPILYHLPFDFFKGKRLLHIFNQIRSFTTGMIKDIGSHYDPENLDNYIVAYIDEMKREQKSLEKTYLDDINLSRNIDTLFIAGSETTSTTIMWCLLYVLNYPDTQKKIYDEIVEHVGTERSPNINDKPKLKYLTAFIMEVQRIASIVPLSVPHICNTESTIAGYTIPEGSIVQPNLDAVLGSIEIWGDPENFRPERFIDEEGNIIKREELIPFSIGRRVCLGESLARMELFLYLSTLFQKFEMRLPSPDKVPPLNKQFGGVAAPESYELRLVKRCVV